MKINATVKSLSRDHIRIAPEPGYCVVVFRIGGGAEIVIIDRDHTETTRLHVEAPPEGQRLEIRQPADVPGGFDLVYAPDTLAWSNRACLTCGAARYDEKLKAWLYPCKKPGGGACYLTMIGQLKPDAPAEPLCRICGIHEPKRCENCREVVDESKR